jgi:tetratricopeptide (TPR) repeat protein
VLSPETSNEPIAPDAPPAVAVDRASIERVFVGREACLARLDEVLASAEAGHGRLVFVVGDAGIGKTRTLEEFAARVVRQGHRVLAGRCPEGDGAPAFLPWTEVLERWLAHPAADHAVAAAPGAAVDVAAIVPALRAKCADVPVPSPLVPEHARFRLFDGVARLVREATRQETLVVLLEDVHWADPASMRLLAFLAHQIGDVRLLLVASHRPLPDGLHPLRDPLAEAVRAPWCGTIVLEGLAVGEVHRFVTLATGHAPAPALVEAIDQCTGGNPLLVRECIRLLGAGTDGADVARVTAALREPAYDVLGVRLDALPPATVDLLRTAAVLGREFDVQVVAEMTERPVLDVLAALDPALAMRLVVPVRTRLAVHRFTHVLVQERLYHDIPDARRKALHLRAARALEACQERCPDLRLGEMLSYHFDASGPEGDPPKAATWALHVAESAGARLAHEEAVRQYERALRALSVSAPADRRRHAEVCLRLGEARALTADLPGARDAFRAAAADARALDAPALLARAALGFAGRGMVIGWPDPDAIAVLDEAAGALRDPADVLRARVLGRLAMELCYSAQWERCATVCDEAAELGRRIPDVQTLSYALTATRYLPRLVDIRDRIAEDRALVALAESRGEWEVLLDTRSWSVRDLVEAGDLRAAAEEIEICARLAEQLRHPLYRYRVVVCRALLAGIEGRAADVERLAEEYSRLGARVCPLNATVTFAAQMTSLRRAWGPVEDLDGLIAAADARHPLPVWAVGRALVRAESGDLAAARSDLDRLAPSFDDLPHDAFVWMSTVTLFADIVTLVGDACRAEQLYALLRPFAGRILVSGTADCYGAADRFLGRLATVLGRFAEAERHFVDAIALNEALGARPLLAATQRAFAEMLAVRDGPGDRVRAESLIDAALRTARALGMRVVVARVEGLRARLRSGVTPGTDAPVTVVRRDGREWIVHGRWGAVAVPDGPALRCLTVLLAHPGRECLALDVAAAARAAGGPVSDGTSRAAAVHARPSGDDRSKAGSAAERARLNVTRAVRRLIDAIGRDDPALGRHLARSIRTGTYCVYRPR